MGASCLLVVALSSDISDILKIVDLREGQILDAGGVQRNNTQTLDFVSSDVVCHASSGVVALSSDIPDSQFKESAYRKIEVSKS